ncbi:sentrin-specific protease 7 [Fistulifera solaris]|uniref:Sentrin-specific protease 7 n=1 Tax=Fistulifera solaris TaxID=1519565 RepID=A0A1Z5JCW6_FISSO|nr:sentrin-specific protease 7 [Fistulifera solaris]|eukprot:GAX11796.1 sentrin-specific protease 7 [Fistulifera solaris]
MSEFKSRKKRSRHSPASTIDYYAEGPPKTSGRGHQGTGKLRRNGHVDVTDFSFNNFEEKANFSEAVDSLGFLGEVKMKKASYNSKIGDISQKARKLLTEPRQKESNRKRAKDITEGPLDSVLREQQEVFGRREYRPSSLSSRKKKNDFFETESDDEVQEVTKKYPAQLKLILDKPVKATSPDMIARIPRKPIFGRKGVFRERESNTMLNDDFKPKDAYCSIDLSSSNETSVHSKPKERQKGGSSTAIDLCIDGETESEDNTAIHSKRGGDTFRATKKAKALDQPTGKDTRKASAEEQSILQTLDAIENDKPYVPSTAFTLSKAPSSSEGRKIKETYTSPTATAGTKRKSSLGRTVEVPTNSLKSKKSAKSANAGRAIVPGASLRTNNARSSSDRFLDFSKKRTESRASQESIKPYRDDLSKESCDSSAKLRTKDKPTKNYKDDLFDDDLSSATSVAVEKRSNCIRDTARTLYHTRSSARRSSISDSNSAKRKKNDFVDMVDDGSDDEQNLLVWFDVARIAVGSSVKHHSCQIKIFNDGILSCAYSVRSKEKVHNIDFAKGEVDEVYYYVDNGVDNSGRLASDDAATEPGSFIALKVQKTKTNGFSSVGSYVPGNSTDEKGLIMAEFRSDADIATFLRVVEENVHFKAYFTNDSRLPRRRSDLFATALIADAKKEALSRKKKIGSSKRVGFLAGKASHEILLSFPFGGDPRLIDDTARGLNEFQFANCTDTEMDEVDIEDCDQGTSSDIRNAEGSEDTRRRHHVEIRVEDFERLDPGVYLNDTLIDFFLQWMTRKHTSPDFHVFTTHFYTTLEDNGVEGVSNWTTKKKIDVFKLRFVFIPINKALHWSLCVVVNPGYILSSADQSAPSSGDDAPMPCLLFFDSLKMHQKDRVHRNVTKWLNAEWMRLRKSAVVEAPFNKSSLPVLTPKVPYQNNSWDCGVFVCRYASGVFQLRNRAFSYKELMEEKIAMISCGAEFKFTLDDIANLREEMKELIERLSTIYLRWKANRDQPNRLNILAENRTKEEANEISEKKKSEVSEDKESRSAEEKESGSTSDNERGFSDKTESLDKMGHSENSQRSLKSEGSKDSGSGLQLLNTPTTSREETSDVMLIDNDHDEDDSSPNSLVTQPDFDAFDNRIAKENVDSRFKRSSLYDLKSSSEDNGMQYADESSSQYHHDDYSAPSDSASV